MGNEKKKLKPLPTFKSEAEEAQWYFDHQDELLDYFEVVRHEVPLHVRLGLPPRKKPPTKQVPLRIQVDDLERAQKLADQKGIGYQTLLKMLIHEGLEREEKKTG